MSALPASALDDVAPIHGALYVLPAAADPVRLLDRRPACLLRALDALRPVIECSSPSVYPGPSAIEALLLATAAHAELGDVRAVGDSIERAPA